MKRKLCFLLFAAAMVICFCVVPAQALKIANFNVSDSYITPGESFDVDVSVYDDGTLGDLTGFGFDVDPLMSLSLFSFDYYIIAPDFTDLGSGNHVEGVYLGTGNAGTDVRLATLSFTAGLTTGTDTLEIDGPFSSTYSGLFYWDFDTNIYTDEDLWGSLDITVVPEPTTMLLLATGLAGMGVFGRKKLRK